MFKTQPNKYAGAQKYNVSAAWLVGFTLSLAACGASDGSETDGSETETVDTVTQPLSGEICSNQGRSDFQGSITITSGNGSSTDAWGSWTSCYDFCPNNTYIWLASTRSEPWQGTSADDTAMNALYLGCLQRGAGNWENTVANHEGYWGTQGAWARIGAADPYEWLHPLIGGKVRLHGNQGTGDDTSINGFVGQMKGGATISPPSNTSFGSWTSTTSCPPLQAVCGIKVRMRTPRGSADDTALNGIKFACCTFTP